MGLYRIASLLGSVHECTGEGDYIDCAHRRRHSRSVFFGSVFSRPGRGGGARKRRGDIVVDDGTHVSRGNFRFKNHARRPLWEEGVGLRGRVRCGGGGGGDFKFHFKIVVRANPIGWRNIIRRAARRKTLNAQGGVS